MAQGFQLTVRQLYYQFVSRDLIPNTMKSYKRLVFIINRARLAGLVDWDAIVDRTRFLRGYEYKDTPQSAIYDTIHDYRLNPWKHVYQEYWPEVWIEKDALVGVIERVCLKNRVNYFATRGFSSQSAQREAALRLVQTAHQHDKEPVILMLSDHDPSGLDMYRDNDDRLYMFAQAEGGRILIERIALTMEQVEEFKPPPNPAKETDTRYAGYVRAYGPHSWELDALDPSYLESLIDENLGRLKNSGAWEETMEQEREDIRNLDYIASNFDDLIGQK
jgi:hypothetical protein